MSSMDNHRRRSRRGNGKKRAAFGSMVRKAWITPMRYGSTTLGLWPFGKRKAKNGRGSKKVRAQTEAAAEE